MERVFAAAERARRRVVGVAADGALVGDVELDVVKCEYEVVFVLNRGQEVFDARVRRRRLSARVVRVEEVDEELRVLRGDAAGVDKDFHVVLADFAKVQRELHRSVRERVH